MVRLLDVDGGDIVGQEHQLIGVQLFSEFPRQVFLLNDAALKKANHECSCPREGVQDMDALIRKTGFEFLLQGLICASDDEVDDFYRSVDNSKSFGHLRESRPEELIIEFDDDLLPSLGVIHALDTLTHAVVEAAQDLHFLFYGLFFQEVDHALHGLRNGVKFGELIVLKKGVEHWLSNHVLSQHLDGIFGGDAGVERLA